MRNNPTQGNDKKNINVRALEYMEQKYGEKFEYVAPWGNSMSGTHELIVKCDSLNGQDVLVEIEHYKEDDRIFRDNYLEVKYYENTLAFLKKCADDVFGNSKVFYNVSYTASSSGLSADASFEDFLADERGFISAYIAVRSGDFRSKEQVEGASDAILSACGAGYINIMFVVVDDSEYESLDTDILGKKVISKQFVYCAELVRKGDNVRLEWLGED